MLHACLPRPELLYLYGPEVEVPLVATIGAPACSFETSDVPERPANPHAHGRLNTKQVYQDTDERTSPKNMLHGTTRTTLSLELQAPQLRPEAFPWGSANVEIHAICTSEACRRVTGLPGAMDISATFSPGEQVNSHSQQEMAVRIEVMGCEKGVTFTLGTVSIPLPPMMQPSTTPESQFRVCLTSEEGVRVGTLVGKFRARRRISDNLEAGEALCIRAPQSHPSSAAGEFRGNITGGTVDVREAANGLASQQTIKDGHQRLEHEAIELLDSATKILDSPTSCAGRRDRPFDGLTAARVASHESTNEPGCQDDPRKRQGLDVPPTDVSDCLNVGDLDFKFDSTPFSKEEDEVPLSPRFPTAGFKFEPTTGSVEWQRIASVDVSKVEREGDLQTLRQFLPEVAVGMVDGDDFDANPCLVNAFRLAQLQTQYVLHCSQVLQRTCDGLETTVAGMEMETKGNLQGSTALRNRARLLRKESRKQDKIISGYAAMLRTHNPGLSSKVFLDEKGRLKVHKPTSHREDVKRRTKKRRNRGSRDHYTKTREGETFTNNGSRSSSDTEGRSLGSRVSSGCSSRHWSEAEGHSRSLGSPRPLSNRYNWTAAPSIPEDEGSAFHLDTGEENAGSPTGQREVIVTGQDRTIGVRTSFGETMTPRERRGSSNAANSCDGDVVQVLLRGGARRGDLPLRGHARREGDALPAHPHRSDSPNRPGATFQPRGSENAAPIVTSPSIGALSSGSHAWATAGADEGRWLPKVGVTSGSDNQVCAPPSTGQRVHLDRASKTVTVSVKPIRNQRPSSASSQEDTSASSPHRPGSRARNKDNTSGTYVPRRNDGTDSGEASPVTPGFTSVRGEVPPVERAAAANSEKLSLGRLRGSRGAKGEDQIKLGPGSPAAPVAAASQLGLEGDGFPDVSEFDLDDISEIDAGGEWAESDGGGSLSS